MVHLLRLLAGRVTTNGADRTCEIYAPRVIPYFGKPWPANFFAEQTGRQIATPVGQKCIWCDEPIVMGDQGIVTPYVCCTIEPEYEPIHRECLTRTMAGSIAHVTGRCACNGHVETPYPGSKRQEAMAVQAVVDDDQLNNVDHYQVCKR